MLDPARVDVEGTGQVRLRLVYGCAATVVVLLGLGVRYPGLGLPWPLAKYAGSVLWGMMVYFVVGFAAPKAAISHRAGAASIAALLVELIRLYHVPWLDDFRLTLAGGLLLGRVFSPWNLVAYWVGILGGVAAEKLAMRR